MSLKLEVLFSTTKSGVKARCLHGSFQVFKWVCVVSCVKAVLHISGLVLRLPALQPLRGALDSGFPSYLRVSGGQDLRGPSSRALLNQQQLCRHSNHHFIHAVSASSAEPEESR